MHEGADSQRPRLKVGNSSSLFSFDLTEIKERHEVGCNLFTAVLLPTVTMHTERQRNDEGTPDD